MANKRQKNGITNLLTRKLWYKEFLANGDLLEIDISREDEEIKMSKRRVENHLKLPKITTERFKWGGEQFMPMKGKKDISVYCSNLRERRV